jgi:hypothetical protein
VVPFGAEIVLFGQGALLRVYWGAGYELRLSPTSRHAWVQQRRLDELSSAVREMNGYGMAGAGA